VRGRLACEQLGRQRARRLERSVPVEWIHRAPRRRSPAAAVAVEPDELEVEQAQRRDRFLGERRGPRDDDVLVGTAGGHGTEEAACTRPVAHAQMQEAAFELEQGADRPPARSRRPHDEDASRKRLELFSHTDD